MEYKAKKDKRCGRLVKHSTRPEWGTGIIKDSRIHEKFDRQTDEGGLFVVQYKVWFSAKGEGWHDASSLLWLPTDVAPSAT